MKRARPLGVGALLVAGCSAPNFRGVDVISGQSVALGQGPKLPEHSFTGRYRSPQSGEISLVQRGSRLAGTYTYYLCSCPYEGKLWGEVTGNHALVEFREHSATCNPEHVLEGKGELFYRAIALEASPPQLFGSRAYLSVPAPPRGFPQRERSVWTAVAVDPRESPAGIEPHCP